MRANKLKTDEKGFILVTILLVIAVLLPLILAFSAKVQLNLIQAENFRNSIQALRSARSGVAGAIGILKADDASYDAKTDKWAAAFPPLAFGDGILNVVITDEDGKFPINNLVTVKSTQTAANTNATGGATTATTSAAAAGTTAAGTTTQAAGATASASGATLAAGNAGGTATGNVVTYQINKDLVAQLRSLITQLGGKPEIVDALIDWLDPDNDVTGTEGAEEDYYKQRGYHCKNGPLDSLDELLLIKGFDNELLIDKNLKSYLTIAPTDGKVNLNTAPIQVLYAVLGTKTDSLAQPMSQSDIQDLVRYRDGHDLKNVTDMTSAIKISQDQASAAAALVKVNSAYFTVNSRYTIGNVVKNVEALLKRGDKTITTISWREF
jgi:type II secretory pathway component PulK